MENNPKFIVKFCYKNPFEFSQSVMNFCPSQFQYTRQNTCIPCVPYITYNSYFDMASYK